MKAESVRLDIPGSAEFLRLARLTVADIGARAGFGFEDIDDLRIAVDELCYAIGAGDDSIRLQLVYRLDGNRVEVEGLCEPAVEVQPPTELATAIITAVVDDFSLTTESGGSRFRFAKSGNGP